MIIMRRRFWHRRTGYCCDLSGAERASVDRTRSCQWDTGGSALRRVRYCPINKSAATVCKDDPSGFALCSDTFWAMIVYDKGGPSRFLNPRQSTLSSYKNRTNCMFTSHSKTFCHVTICAGSRDYVEGSHELLDMIDSRLSVLLSVLL